MKVLILGGYGAFGGRLVELLADESALELLIAGRSARKAQAFCAAHGGAASMVPLAVDRSGVEAVLVTQRPDLLVDASGPFQDYGEARYSVVEACIAHGVGYVDFADGSEFVIGIDRYDEAARAAGVFVLSGVSSFPVLTAAVIRELEQAMEVEQVAGGLAPSPYVGIGLNVVRAVLGYAGGPVRLKRHGTDTVAGGFCESMRYTVAPPGRMPLDNLRFSLVDVPDLRVIPRDHPGIRELWMGAAPQPEALHRMLNGLARLRWLLHLPAPTPLARVCCRVVSRLRFGEHRGGMFVDARGRGRNGRPSRRSWHLLAEGDDGPYIPSMAIALIVRRALHGKAPAAGARAAAGELTLRDYDEAFSGRRIYTGFRRQPDEGTPPFKTVLGDCFEALPRPLRDFHGGDTETVWTGEAEARAGSNAFARAIARLVGFPTKNEVTRARVTVARTDHGEAWHRELGAVTFRSLLFAGNGRDEHLLCEQFGWVTVSMAIVWDGERLAFVPRRWRLGRVPLPQLLLPKGGSYEAEKDGRFAFDVRLELPLIGLLAAYRGTLRPSDLCRPGARDVESV